LLRLGREELEREVGAVLWQRRELVCNLIHGPCRVAEVFFCFPDMYVVRRMAFLKVVVWWKRGQQHCSV
jgi:hypothetical protein